MKYSENGALVARKTLGVCFEEGSITSATIRVRVTEMKMECKVELIERW